VHRGGHIWIHTERVSFIWSVHPPEKNDITVKPNLRTAIMVKRSYRNSGFRGWWSTNRASAGIELEYFYELVKSTLERLSPLSETPSIYFHLMVLAKSSTDAGAKHYEELAESFANDVLNLANLGARLLWHEGVSPDIWRSPDIITVSVDTESIRRRGGSAKLFGRAQGM
jgi:hypothetical protein